MTKTTFAHSQLRGLVERIERLEEEKRALSADIRQIYSEAKANGFDPKILRKVIRLRAMDVAARQEEEAMIDIYMAGLGGGETRDTHSSFSDAEVTSDTTSEQAAGETALINSAGKMLPPVADPINDATPSGVEQTAGVPQHVPPAVAPQYDSGQANSEGEGGRSPTKETGEAGLPPDISSAVNSPDPAASHDDDLTLPAFLKRPKPGSSHYLGAG